jgi:hypothetical protein
LIMEDIFILFKVVGIMVVFWFIMNRWFKWLDK